jgi:cleavage stimulation factor subunit 3
MDKDSGTLWQDYISFIKTGPGIVGGTGWQDTQKMDMLRSAYQKTISIPTSALNALWKEYNDFETGLSKLNVSLPLITPDLQHTDIFKARKFLQERSPAYMTARSCYTQLQNLTRSLVRTTRPKLPPGSGYDGDAEYRGQVETWKQWIQWEKDDNLVLKDEDVEAYRNRILFTYKQALMALQFWPEIPYDAAEFCFAQGLDSEGLKFLNRGITANPESCLLAFKMGDRLELGSSNDDASDPGAKQRMQKVREPYDKVLDALYDLITRNKAREESEMRRIQASLAESNEASAVDETSYQQVDTEANAAAAQAQIEERKRHWQAETELLRRTLSFAWIALMRAARRIQGKGMPSEKTGGFRAIFQDARKKGKLTSEFYVESALIEYHCYGDTTVTKIFERGIKLFPEDEYFALAYLKHLLAKSDVTNARAVFETTVAKLTANEASVSKAKPLFIFFHDYESHYGDLIQIAKLEARMASLYPDDLGLRQFASRFKSPSFDPTAVTAIVSTQQTVPKQNVYPSIETTNYGANSPAARIIESINTNSPKRAFPDDFEDSQPRKVVRGESPLKGAAGRRMATQQRGANGMPVPAMPPAQAGPPPLPNAVNYLLTIIPKASTYSDTRFDAVKIMGLIRDIRLPPPIAIGSARHDQPQAAAPSWQPPQFQHGPPASLPPPGYMPPGANPPFGGMVFATH